VYVRGVDLQTKKYDRMLVSACIDCAAYFCNLPSHPVDGRMLLRVLKFARRLLSFCWYVLLPSIIMV